MGKLDTAGIEFLEGDGPLVRPRVAKKPVKPAVRLRRGLEQQLGRKLPRQPQNGLQGVSSYRLVRELTHRHYKFVVRAVFFMGLGAVIVIITRG